MTNPPMDKQELLALASAVEKLEGPDQDVNMNILLALGWYQRDFVTYTPQGNYARRIPDYLGSLDDAVSLVPDGHDWHMMSDGNVSMSNGEGKIYSALCCATPALALCAASLRAIASQEGE